MTLIRMFQPASLALAAALALAFTFAASPLLAEELAEEQAGESAKRSYFEYMVGMSSSPDQTAEGDSATGSGLKGDAEADPAGYFVGVAAGSRFLEHFRAELQLGYRSSAIDNIALQGEKSDSKGDLSLFSLLVNGYVDWDFGIGVIPFVGVGIGWGVPRLDVENEGGATRVVVDDTDSVFVWNAMVGGSLPLSANTDLSLGYRYIATEEIALESRVGATSQRLKFEYDAHELYVGLRFSF